MATILFSIWQLFQKQIFETWMRVAIRNEYIVVSLTTTPHRINNIIEVIDFVLAENIPLKKLYVNIPFIFKRDNIEYVIPSWLASKPGVTILRPKDYGPGTKLLGTLEQGQLPQNAIVITVDDDIKYPKNMLLYLAYKASRNKNYAVGYSGMVPDYDKCGQVIIDRKDGIGLKAVMQNNAFVSILEGFAGIAYRPHFFDQTVFEIEDAPKECRNSDDVYLSFHLAKNNVPRQVLREKKMNMNQIAWNYEVGFKKDALHQLTPSPAVRHRNCIEFLKQQYPDVDF